MGYYIAANELSRGLAARQSISLDTARLRFTRRNTFVSHKSDDAPKAIQIAERINKSGPSVWVDVADRRFAAQEEAVVALVRDDLDHPWTGTVLAELFGRDLLENLTTEPTQA